MSENIIDTSAGSSTNLIKYFSQNTDTNNNIPNNLNKKIIKRQNSIQNSFKSNNITNNEDNCSRCGQKVYQVEKIGPVNQVIFHKACFKCLKCAQNLTLKNYFTNPLDASDKQVYCAKDCPKLALGGIDVRAFGIRAAMMAPSSKMNASSDVIRWFGDVPKIGADAMHIREALSAQSEFQRKNLFQNKHNFPFWIKSKEKLMEYQKELEKEQKIDEDRLVDAFQEERINVAREVDSEINQEWEENVRQITDNYERQNKRKESMSYTKELDDLSKTMTSKRKSKMAVLTIKLQTTAREKTADLVKLQSEEMLSLLKKKQEEIKLELTNSENSEELVETFSAMTLPAKIPEAHAPRIRKRDLYHDPIVFNELDKYVFKVAESEHNTFTELVAQLTLNCISDMEKARAIFRWITVKDLNVMTFCDSIKQDTPLGILRGIKFGTETYHTLFMRLCSYAGLICREIKGHSKSVGYEPGLKIGSGNFTNTWNVVLIGSDWWPVQSNWGARHLVLNKDLANQQNGNQQSTKKSRDKIRYEYDEHYFLTDPDEFVMEFLAEDEKWQLLENPISLAQFESLPFIRSVFFHNGLEFGEGCKKAIIETDSNGGAEIKINLPSDSKGLTVFHYHLRFAHREKRRETQFNGTDLERYVFHTITDQLALFSIHVPVPSDYFMEIFSSKVEGINENTGPKSDFTPFKLKCAAKFLIKCSHIAGKLYPLPNCAPGEWGPLKAIRYFGIKPISHPIGVINVEERISIKLQLPKWMKILVKLYFNGVERRSLDQFMNVKIDDDKVITIEIKFPQKGQFGMDIYGLSDDSEGASSSLAHVCKYLINVTHVSNPISLPPANPPLQRNASIASTIIPIQMIEVCYENYDQTQETDTMKANNTVENIYNLPDESQTQTSDITHPSLGPKRSQPLPEIPTQPSSNQRQNSPDVFVPGPTPFYNAFGLKTTSHKNAKIDKLDKNGAFVTEFTKPVGVKMSAKLATNLGGNLSDLISTKDANKKCKFSVNLPKYGSYFMSILACNQHGQSQHMVDVYHYELNHKNPKATLKSKSGSMKKK